MKRVDVAIIGAGPAGSTLAALLARRGASTLLVDRDTFPRDKVCGEFLSYDALPLLDPETLRAIDEAGAPAIHRGRLVGRKRTLDFSLPAAARGVSRRFLDHLLLQRARTDGATIVEGCTASEIATRGNGATLTVDCAGVLMRVEATVVAGAWGRWGRFDQILGRSFVHDKRTRSFGFKRHYVAASGAVSDSIDLYSFAHGYLGANQVEGGATNICGLVHGDRLAGHKGRWDSFVEMIRREEPQLDMLYRAHEPQQDAFLTSEPVIFRARAAVERGIFMTGDASGIIDPLTGNGMAMAIQSAWLAAPHILQVLAAPSRRGDAERAYSTAHHDLFAARIRWSRAIAALLARPALLERAIGLPGARSISEALVGRTRATERQVAALQF